jgi:competence protein ComEC
MTALQPGTAVDAGFQLSLAATAGLITLGPWIRRGLDAMAEAARVPWLLPPAISEVASLTLSATAATLPITWVTFGRVSLISPLANVVAAPVVAVGFPAALLTAVAGALWEPAGWLLGLGAYYPLALLDWLASAFAGLPLAAIATPAAGNETAVVAAAALAAVGWLAYLRPPGEERPHAPPSPPAFRRLGLAAGMGGFAVAVLRTSLLPVSGGDELIVSFLDVGQGDAILVTTPGNHRTLVDGGPSGIDLARQLSSQLPHWERGLDRIILTHPQEDHVGGLPAALARYDVGEVLTNGARSGTQTMTLFAAHMGGRTLAAGDRWEEDGVRFEVLWPPAGYRADDPNDAGIVLRITFGRTSFLLTADIEAGPQQALLAAGLEPASVLKVPHHGSKTSEARFLQAAGARLAVIQVGAGNRFGHPAAETLAALAGSTILRTDLDGRITVRSDGRRLRFTTSR